ncbi:MAG TPA: hypothetical protein VFV78_00830 [Vicinamibacterales bacterium]|nr:hypothetical protein [Vicinamibacterales bacterium]
MGRINIGRLVAGGVVAGIVGNALHYVTNVYLMDVEMTDMMQRLNLNQFTVESSAVTWIVVDFIWGLLLVFAYAAMRPRFGPGPGTAAISSITLWAGVVSVFAGLAAMGIYTQQAFIKESALNLVVVLASGLAGAYVYKEE